MADQRPNPDELLQKVEADEAKARRGSLKVFLGYAAGVGKTYAMLQEARRLAEGGVDVVVGYVEPHGRPETEALLVGLPALPTLEIAYRGTTLRELDVDAALARKPQVLLVDELAHTNAPGSRHVKRWQDIDEILAAGIDVHTTCNVQHIESLNDVVAQISGVIVRETVPDDVINHADELTLIDITPEDLLERLRAGKVYIAPQAERAMQNFFRKENLVALREMALRRAAERVHVDVQTARLGSGSGAIWATRECLLVCVGPSPSSAKVIRAAKRLSNSLHAEFVAVHVENEAARALSAGDRTRLATNLRLAQNLGAEIVTLTGEDVVAEILDYAQRRNVTKIIVGKTEPRRGRWGRRDSMTDRLIRESANVDIYVVRGTEEPPPPTSFWLPRQTSPPFAWWGTFGILAATTALAWLLDWLQLGEANVIMTFLLGVVLTSVFFGRWPSIVSSFLSVLSFDVLFVKPYYTIVAHDSRYMVTFCIMLAVGLVTSALMTHIHRQAAASRLRERRLEALYRLGRKLTGIIGRNFLAAETERVMADVFGCEAVILLPEGKRLHPIVDHRAPWVANDAEIAVAQWVFDHQQPAGRGTDTLPAAQAFYLPLASPEGTLGVLAIKHSDLNEFLVSDSRSLLEAFASLLALALERDRLTLESQEALVKATTQELRSTLLASVTHDLRTPLAAIVGATSSLLQADAGAGLDHATRHELLTTIYEEADHLCRLVENLLRLTQLNSDRFTIEKEWCPVEEIIGSALRRLERSLGTREVKIELPDELLMGQFDVVLMEQALVNLLENANRYTPHDTPITIRGLRESHGIAIRVEDRGPGIAPHELQTIFETFQRGSRVKSDSRGAGLGLAICRAIVRAHGGTIRAENRPDGGAAFHLWLPVEELPREIAQAAIGPAVAT
jgi:two-component system sensor histidine kinase KdpD